LLFRGFNPHTGTRYVSLRQMATSNVQALRFSNFEMSAAAEADWSVELEQSCGADTVLMLRVRRGDDGCLALLTARYRVPILRFLYRMVRDYAVAEDLTQEVFLRICRSRLRYEPTAKFSSWIYRIAANLASNWRRDQRLRRNQESLDEVAPDGWRRQLPDRQPGTDQMLVRQARLNAVRSAIAALPERQRQAVLMQRYEEMDYREIAAAMDCSTQTVRSLLFRAHAMLRTRLANLDVA
ncbi:MAG: sigma-70 family RNA polymerase sigma factor, partial [Bryobacteraceae bacterium]